jgi:mono/diheme cytochrome c family protein
MAKARSPADHQTVKLRAWSTILVASALAAGPLQAEQGSPRSGEVLARGTCAGCHAVDAFQAGSPMPEAPTFPELAKTPGMTEAALTVALTTPHAGMPMFRLSADQRADIIAYILGLKPGR